MSTNSNVYNRKLLSLMLEQFQTRHSQLPKRIIVSPTALAILALRKSIAPAWNGIPILCQEVIQPTKNPKGDLGIDLDEDGQALRSFDL